MTEQDFAQIKYIHFYYMTLNLHKKILEWNFH